MQFSDTIRTACKPIAPKRSERGLLVGQTGTGKSTLGIHLLPEAGSVLALDPKGDLGGPKGLFGYHLVTSLHALRWCRKDKIQLRIHPRLDDDETWDRIFWFIWERKNTFIFIDDINLINPGAFPLSGVRACVTTGRSRGIGMLTASQRPSGIPAIFRTESEWCYAFHLATRDDLDRVAEEAFEDDVVKERRATGYQFWVKHKSWSEPKIMELHLDSG